MYRNQISREQPKIMFRREQDSRIGRDRHRLIQAACLSYRGAVELCTRRWSHASEQDNESRKEWQKAEFLLLVHHFTSPELSPELVSDFAFQLSLSAAALEYPE
jgi:hypothetical protein